MNMVAEAKKTYRKKTKAATKINADMQSYLEGFKITSLVLKEGKLKTLKFTM